MHAILENVIGAFMLFWVVPAETPPIPTPKPAETSATISCFVDVAANRSPAILTGTVVSADAYIGTYELLLEKAGASRVMLRRTGDVVLAPNETRDVVKMSLGTRQAQGLTVRMRLVGDGSDVPCEMF